MGSHTESAAVRVRSGIWHMKSQVRMHALQLMLMSVIEVMWTLLRGPWRSIVVDC